jgi:hypothetical protein
MDDPRPGAVSADAPWPLLAVLIETTGTFDGLTFAVSDTAPDTDTDIGSVVLGIDRLTDAAGGMMTFLARFDGSGCTVWTAHNGAASVPCDAEVKFSDGAVSITTRLPGWKVAPGQSPSAFCLIDDITYQVDVPVVVIPG